LENQEFSNFITFSDIIEKLKRGKLILLASFSLALVFVLLYNHFTTPLYRASTTVTIEQFSKDDILNSEFSSALYMVNFVANRIKEIKTSTFAQKVYEELPDSARALFRLPDPLPEDFDHKNYVVKNIQGSVMAVSSENASNTIIITFDSEHPVLAQTVANTIALVLQQNNLQYRRQEFSNLRKFIEEQIGVVKESLQSAEDKLRSFKSDENITSLENETIAVLRRITEAEILYNQIQTEKKAREKRLNLIRKKIAEQKETIGISVIGSSTPFISKLKERYVELEVQYTNLRVEKYPEDHPKTLELRAEIDQLREKIINATMDIVKNQKTEGFLDPLVQLKSYVEESISLEIEFESLQAQENLLQKTLRSYNERLKTLSTEEVSLYGLLRDREVYNKNYIKLLEEREQARLQEAAEIGNIHVIDPASKPSRPEKPRKLLNILVAVFAGTFIGFLLIFLKESINDAPRTREELESALKLPILASISKVKNSGVSFTSGSPKKSIVMNNGTTDPFYHDAYSYLWSYLQALNHGNVQTILITSAIPREGKSTVAANLAITVAKLGIQTILIDGDVRRPTVHQLFKIPKTPGLSDLVSRAMEVKADPSEFLPFLNSVVQVSSVENLRVLTAGDPIVEPSIIWNTPFVEEILTSLRQDADLLIIDSPPLGIPDAISIASHADTLLFCIGAGEAGKKILLDAQKLLEQSNRKFTGIIWNKVDPVSIYGKSKYQR
jgi:capsular exopolysaccharide synthesis family protein